jgi:hypothetical protein
MGKYQRPPNYEILRGAGRDEDQGIAGENRLSTKRRKAGMN